MMNEFVERLHELERRTRTLERQLRTWRVLALVIVIGAAGYAWVLPGQAQPGGTPASAFKAPFTVTGTNGVKLLEVTEYADKTGGDSQDTLLTLFRNGYPAAMYRTTGKFYKDAYDPADS
jgi:hypothetical protein